MRKFFFASVIIAAATIAFSQSPASQSNEPPNQGLAPKVPNGVGRADVRVFDESGNPLKDASVKLESKRTDGYFCETDWFTTNEQGVIVLPPLHMGRLKFKVRAKGYHSQNLRVIARALGEPVRITLKKK